MQSTKSTYCTSCFSGLPFVEHRLEISKKKLAAVRQQLRRTKLLLKQSFEREKRQDSIFFCAAINIY